MRAFVLIVAIALLLDTLIGDPRWGIHPVRLMGACASFFESLCRRAINNEIVAGAVAWVLVLASTTLPAVLLLSAARSAGTAWYIGVSAFYLYVCIAPRDLAGHAVAAAGAIKSGDGAEARRRTSYMVSRDVSELDNAGLTRAVIESTAENVVDGVTAPIIFAALFGPVGAVAYRAANTLDAMFGYKNDTYLQFGRVSAKADDVLGWLPARITGPLYCVSAALVGGSVRGALRVMLRDHRKHESPNAGVVESAAAGALGIQLGGAGVYSGVVVEKPRLGDPDRTPESRDITKLIVMMYATTALVAAAAVGIAYVRLTVIPG